MLVAWVRHTPLGVIFPVFGESVKVFLQMTATITRTGAGHALQIQVVRTGRDTIGVTRASMELLTQMGVKYRRNGGKVS